MSNLHRYYTLFLSSLDEFEPRDNFLNQSRKPKLSDKALIALNLAAEATSIDSELNLFRQLPPEVKGSERSVYNKRQRNLADHTQRLQKLIADSVVPNEDYHLIDSMPLEACKMSRANRSRICTEHPESAPDFGYCKVMTLNFVFQ